MALILFDLDGTLTPQRPSSMADFERRLRVGIQGRCRELIQAGHTLAIATNQGGIARGFPRATVESHIEWLRAELGITSHRLAWDIEHKKPSPTMLLELMEEFGATALDTCMIGDSLDDEAAARAANVRFLHVDHFIAKGLG